MSELTWEEEKSLFEIFYRVREIEKVNDLILDLNPHSLIEWYLGVTYDIYLEIEDYETGEIIETPCKVKTTRYKGAVFVDIPEDRQTHMKESYILTEQIPNTADILDDFLDDKGYYTREEYERISDIIGMDLETANYEHDLDDRILNWLEFERYAEEVAREYEDWSMRETAKMLGESYAWKLKDAGYILIPTGEEIET